MLKYDFHRGWYLPSNGTIANVVLRGLYQNFQGHKLETLISLKRWELSQKFVIGLLPMLIFVIKWLHCECCIAWCSFSRTNVFLLRICYKNNCAGSGCFRQICLDSHGLCRGVALVIYAATWKSILYKNSCVWFLPMCVQTSWIRRFPSTNETTILRRETTTTTLFWTKWPPPAASTRSTRLLPSVRYTESVSLRRFWRRTISPLKSYNWPIRPVSSLRRRLLPVTVAAGRGRWALRPEVEFFRLRPIRAGRPTQLWLQRRRRRLWISGAFDRIPRAPPPFLSRIKVSRRVECSLASRARAEKFRL